MEIGGRIELWLFGRRKLRSRMKLRKKVEKERGKREDVFLIPKPQSSLKFLQVEK